jgi:NADH:ubiquinone oxidoreductase subunit 5 (subunit L)/multisubunit Na+/H+ antiporter MnhA subunit/multisubunit Na+/H+ antiporter MnhB subunit
MIETSSLLLPLIILTLASGIAALFGIPALNRRLTTTRLCWLLALAPLAAFLLLLRMVTAVNDGTIFIWTRPWLPSLGLNIGLYVDSLSLFFALIVTFIGVLIVVYAGQYFKGDQGAWRFMAYLLLFMASMVGVVMAGDVLTLFLFWEGTSILSFLLVAYKYQYEEARFGAFRALFITGGGGIAMLAGLLFVSYVAGGTDFATILSSGDVLRSNEFYLVMLLLVAAGAFTKSAQWPFHIWLPGAMSAPTPASAYLHSATMVKAGVYLMARMNPALGFTEEWFWLLTVTGGMTMLAGAYLGFKQNDWKALLAYSTISQLGILMILIGQDIPEAFKALVIGVLAHALYKSALFMTAGIIDHETGTRDLRRLGGLRKVMPFTFFVGTLAALSMAGLPPMFGFLAKETLLATAVHPSLPPLVSELFRWGAVLAGALMLAMAGLIIWETFMGKRKDTAVHAHEAPWPMWLAPAVPAALSLWYSIAPGFKEDATLLTGAAQAAYGGNETIKVYFKLFHGLTVELMLSLVAISLGTLIFIFRRRVREWMAGILPNASLNALYVWLLAAIDKSAYWATRVQQGKLRTYLAVMITAVLLLVVGLSFPTLDSRLHEIEWPDFNFQGQIRILWAFSLLLVVGASAAAIILRRDFSAIMAFTASGLAMALLFVLTPAPDVALVQIVVDILALVILMLALSRLPREQRRKAQAMSDAARARRKVPWRDLLIAGAFGLVIGYITLINLLERPHVTAVTPFYEENAKLLTGATDIVGAIVVDFRALDTLIEISVFALAGLGISLLLHHAAKKHGDEGRQMDDPLGTKPSRFATYGIGGIRTSAFIRVPAYATLPMALVLAATQMMYGHDQPGDGFTAGVIISLSIGLWYMVFGYHETRRRLPWLKASALIGSGILLGLATGFLAVIMTGSFLGNVNFAKGWSVLPSGFYISSSFLLEVAICMTVLGSVAHMLNTLGHPQER